MSYSRQFMLLISCNKTPTQDERGLEIFQKVYFRLCNSGKGKGSQGVGYTHLKHTLLD